MTEPWECNDELRASGTVPYHTYSGETDRPFYTCERCGYGIFPGDFMQRPKVRPRRGNKRGWHYDCNDPRAENLHSIAREDAAKETARTHSHGHKTMVNRYYNNRRRST